MERQHPRKLNPADSCLYNYAAFLHCQNKISFCAITVPCFLFYLARSQAKDSNPSYCSKLSSTADTSFPVLPSFYLILLLSDMFSEQLTNLSSLLPLSLAHLHFTRAAAPQTGRMHLFHLHAWREPSKAPFQIYQIFSSSYLWSSFYSISPGCLGIKCSLWILFCRTALGLMVLHYLETQTSLC